MTSTTSIPCQICKVEDSLYRCPACLIRTCSLVCCKVHKEKQGCNGKRDRTAFVPVNKFTDSTVASDFHFLEDVLTRSDRGKRLIKDLGMSQQRGTGKRKRVEDEHNSPEEVPLHPLSKLKLASDKKTADGGLDMAHEFDNDATKEDDERQSKIKGLVQVCDEKGNKGMGKGTPAPSKCDPSLSQYPKHKQRLVQKAKERNVNLLLMPPGMQRHIMNKSTKFDLKSDTMQWKVEIIFHIISKNSSETCNEKRTKTILTLDRVPESDNVYQHLSKAFEKQLSHSAPSETRSILVHFRQSTNYELKSSPDVVTMMKKIPCKSSQPSYYKVDLKQNLREMLSGMSIIEFPTVEVVLKEDGHYFPLMIEEM